MKIFLSLSPTFLRGGSLKTYHVLRSKNLDSLDKFETKVMQGIDGLMFKGDASHKVTKLIYVNTDEKVYHGLYTIMNEYGQVTGWWYIRTGKMEELESSIRRLKKRYEINNFKRPEIVYSDRPEMDRSMWEKIWPSLIPDTALANQLHPSISTITAFSLPKELNLITLIHKSDECSSVIYRIREILEGLDEQKVLGFDIEWNKGNNPAATIQFSIKTGHSYLFSLKGILGKRYVDY